MLKGTMKLHLPANFLVNKYRKGQDWQLETKGELLQNMETLMIKYSHFLIETRSVRQQTLKSVIIHLAPRYRSNWEKMWNPTFDVKKAVLLLDVL